MHIRIGRFKDDITILDDRQITDTLFEAVEETIKFIKTYMMVAYEFDGNIRRIEKWDYPIRALREAVLNAVVHRNYSEPSDIQIKIYDDKIVIFSPGILYGDLTLEQLKQRNYHSSLRNKLIAEAFYLTGHIEKYGTGFIRIEDELKNFPANSFVFEQIANGMQITFFKTRANGELNGELNDRQKIVYNKIKEQPGIKAIDLSNILKIPFSTVDKYIRVLLNKKLIERRGSKKTGGYFIR